MDFPIADLLDEGACYAYLVRLIHPRGLTCPRCGSGDLRVHRRTRDPVVDYRCPHCKRVFNAFTRTAFHKMQYRPSRLVLILRGLPQGTPTARLARELGVRPPPPADDPAPAPGQRPGPSRRRPAAGRRGRGRRAVPERGGKKGSRTPTRPTRPGGGPTSGAGRGRGTSIGRRCWGRSGARRAGPAAGGAARGEAELVPAVRAARVPRGGGLHRRVVGVQAAAAGRRRARDGLPRGAGSGRGTTTGTACARCTATRWRGSGPG